MLHITGSMKSLKGELYSARNVFKGIISVLEKVDSSTNLTREVGIFAMQMPDYKILAKDADSAKKVLRKVCTGELSANEALTKFKSALKEVEQLQKMLEPLKDS